MTLLCACAEPSSEPRAEAKGTEASELFCRARPLLPFCVDFDEGELPSSFAEKRDDPAVTVTIEPDVSAPSPPNVLVFDRRTASGASEGAWLVTARSPRVTRANAFFLVRLVEARGDVELASLDDESAHRVLLVVRGDGSVVVREVSAAGEEREHVAAARVNRDDWTSVRWDLRGTDGVLRTRLRVGQTTAFDGEPLAFPSAEIAPRLSIGIRSADAARVAFDTITYEATP